MTLSTDIYLTKYIPSEMVIQKISEIMQFDNYRYDMEDSNAIGHCGQGAPAWVFVYANNGKLVPLSEYQTHEKDSDEVDEDGDRKYWVPEHYVHINLDTAYGYGRDIDVSCSDLHAYIIRELMAWELDTKFDLFWQNEFTSEIFEGMDGIEDFGDPDRGGIFHE